MACFDNISKDLAQLYDIQMVENQEKPFRLRSINFKEAQRRLKYKIKDTFNTLEDKMGRKIEEFSIGEVFATSRKGVPFNAMNDETWSFDRIDTIWRDYEEENYDGLVIIGCIDLDTIPENVQKAHNTIDQQKYTLGLKERLLHYFSFINPDKRLRDQSVHPSNFSRKPNGSHGMFIYMAYKLEPATNYSDEETAMTSSDNETVDSTEQIQPLATSESSTHRIQSFQDTLRQMNKRPRKFDCDDAASSSKQSKRSGDQKFDGDRDVDSSKSDENQRSKSPQWSQTFQGNPQNIPSTSAESTDQVHPNETIFTQEQIHHIENSYASHSPSPSILKKKMQFATEEMILILKSYKEQRLKSDFDELTDTVYNQRCEELPREIRYHYENLPHHLRKDRIKRFINECKSGKRYEKDRTINALIAELFNTGAN